MSKDIKLIYLVSFFASFRFYSPILVIYFSQVTGSYATAMTIIAADKIFQAIFEIPTGMFSDLINRKDTLILSGISAIIAISIWAFSQNFYFLLFGTLFSGLSGALTSGNDDALLYDSLKEIGKEDEYHNYYSKLGSFQLTAFSISAFLGGFLAITSFQLAFWISVIFRFIALFTSLFLHNPPQAKRIELNPYEHLKEATKIFITNPKLRLLTLSNAITNSITESTFVFAPVFVNTLWPIWAVGVMRSGNGFANAFSYFISGKVISRFKALNALIEQFIVSRIVLISAYVFPTFISPVLMVFTSLIYGIGQVSQKTLLQKEFTDHQRATMGSLDALLGSIMFAIVSILIGYFADIIGPRNILLIGEILLLPVLFIYWRLFLHHKAQNV